jgi:hypothetical protein
MPVVTRVGAVLVGIVLYLIVSQLVVVALLLLGAEFELGVPSLPWWATIVWWMGLVAVAWYAGFRLAPRVASHRASKTDSTRTEPGA